jgi:hypothetical protein
MSSGERKEQSALGRDKYPILGVIATLRLATV